MAFLLNNLAVQDTNRRLCSEATGEQRGKLAVHFKICSRENKRSSHEAVVVYMYGKVVLTGFKHFSALRGKGNTHHVVLERMT